LNEFLERFALSEPSDVDVISINMRSFGRTLCLSNPIFAEINNAQAPEIESAHYAKGPNLVPLFR